MSAFPFLSHFSTAVVSFPCHPTKVSSTSKYNFFTFSSSPNNGSNYRKVEGGIIKCNSEDSYLQSSESIPHSCSTIKAPTAPWMTEPLFVKPNEMKSMKPRTKKGLGFEKIGEHPDVDLTGKVGGGRGRLAMKKIFKSFQKLQETQDLEATSQNHENRRFKFALGDLWGNGDYGTKVDVEEKHNATEESLESDEFDIPLLESGKEAKLKKLPWEREEKMVIRRAKKEKVVTAAELSLDGMLLERFRHEAALIRKWVKVMKAGVTQAIVDQVHLIWRNDELALLKFDVPLCRNMDRAREIVELKTGGLVVWSNKDFLAVYRGHHYGSRSKNIWIRKYNSASDQGYSSANMKYQSTTTVPRVTSDGSNPDKLIHGKDGKWENLQMASLYEREADRLLDELGPRFVDWWMQKPLPVDGDLLPAVVPGFKTPFRLCPPFTSAKLTDAELTYLRKLARPLPTHFVLGRNRNHQGLAAAILKLWEKCHIAKIALKWGIPNTDNEQMANELKRLTGGVLLIRNKFLIILYRGKDFLPSEVAKVVAEREMELTQCQLREEAARVKASESFSTTHEHLICSGIVGTLSEFHRMHSEMGSLKKGKTEVDVELEAERERLEKELKDQERKLFILKKKIEKSTRVLDKLKNASRLSEEDPDLEIISKEERVCLREMGLRISSSIVLGRRGVYDGVIEGMHQHWKHREVVKVITMQKDFAQVMHTAKCVEAESGGILVAVVKLKEGHAVIVYRGKNFKRPKSAAVNLLNKREALSRSLEIQRLGSLKFFARQREQAICDLKQKLGELDDDFLVYVCPPDLTSPVPVVSPVRPPINHTYSRRQQLAVPVLPDVSPPTFDAPISSSSDPPLSDDRPIALRKGKCSCTYPISSYVSYDHLSPSSCSLVASLASVPNFVSEAFAHSYWRDAMVEEMNALDANGIWELVGLSPGKRLIGCKWVFTVKVNTDGSVARLKARLVAKGGPFINWTSRMRFFMAISENLFLWSNLRVLLLRGRIESAITVEERLESLEEILPLPMVKRGLHQISCSSYPVERCISTITGSEHENCGFGDDSKNGKGGICMASRFPCNISTTLFIGGLSDGAV